MEISIASWNVLARAFYEDLGEKFESRYPPRRLDYTRRLESTVNVVQELAERNNIVCLQEADSELVARVSIALGGSWHVIFAPRPRNSSRRLGPDGVAVFCRPEALAGAVRVHEFLFPYRFERGDGSVKSDFSRRLGISVPLRYGHIPVYLLATHVEWDNGRCWLEDGTSVGLHQAELMLSSFETPSRGIEVIAGDLNSHHGHPCLSRLQSSGFRVATPRRESACAHTGLSWSALEKRYRPTFTDWILARGGSAELRGTEARPLEAPSDAWPSDHFPIEATIREPLTA